MNLLTFLIMIIPVLFLGIVSQEYPIFFSRLGKKIGVKVYYEDISETYKDMYVNDQMTTVGYLFVYSVICLILLIIWGGYYLCVRDKDTLIFILILGYSLYIITIIYLRRDVFDVMGLPGSIYGEKHVFKGGKIFKYKPEYYSIDRYILLITLTSSIPFLMSLGGNIALFIWSIIITTLFLFPDKLQRVSPVNLKTWKGWFFLLLWNIPFYLVTFKIISLTI